VNILEYAEMCVCQWAS